MSEVAKPTEVTPAPAPAVEATSTPAPTAAPAPVTAEHIPVADTTAATTETAPAATKEEAVAKSDAKAEGTPASEGVLGYKGPGLIQSLRFSKRFFWFSDEAFKTDSLDGYLRAEKAEIAHPNAAWAHETGKGLLFFAKRAEDKAAPAGIMNLADVSDVTLEGSNEFSFKLHGHKHIFQAASTTERASWIAAIEAKSTEAKALKEGIVASEGYKSHIDKYNKFGVGAATTGSGLPSLSKSKDRKAASATPRKSTEVKGKEAVKEDKADHNETKPKDGVKKSDTSSVSSSDVEKKEKKSRSQSRKRTSIFGLLGNKKEEQEEKKDVKKDEQKAEKKHEKEIIKEDKKHEKESAKEEKEHENAIAKEHHIEEKKHEKEIAAAEHKPEKEHAKEDKKHEKELAKEEKKHEKELAKEEKTLEKEEKQAEAQATHKPSDIAEAGAASVAAAVPAALATSSDKKADETKPEATTTKGADSTLEKKTSKRSSIFGSLFGGKRDVTSPTTEKTQSEVAPAVPAKDTTEAGPVSETAPKLDEPIQSKPIDTAAVTAPMDSATTAQDPPANSVYAQVTVPSPAAKSPSTPSHKGGVMGFFKRQDSKADQKKEVKAEEPVTSPTAINETPATSETPAAATTTTATTDSKPPAALKEKRRTSIFHSLSTKKDKKTGEPTAETEVAEAEPKKSPLPQKLGGLFRKPSKAVKSEETQTEPPTAAIDPAAPTTEITGGEAAKDAPVKDEPALTNGTPDVPVVSNDRAPEATTNLTPEVKASA